MNIRIHRTSKAILSLIAVALWGILLRPLFTAPQAKAQVGVPTVSQAQTASDPLKPPTIFAVQEGIPYVVLSDGTISVWYLDQKEKLDPKTVTGRRVVENTKLFRVDSQLLPTR